MAVLIGSAVAVMTACGGSAVTDTPGPGAPPVDTTRPPTTVQRASLTVTVSIDAADASLAQQAQVSPAGALARVLRIGGTEPERIRPVDAGGNARFDSLLEGSYAVSVDRSLSDSELARLDASQREVAIFAGGARVNVTPPASQAIAVAMTAARRGSLVVSELFSYAPGPPVFYSFGHYIEVFNNSDSTLYLDGTLLFWTPSVTHSDIWGPCDRNAVFRLDPTTVWASLIWAFPGSGRDYAIAPGTAKVIAMDAMNHRSASPETEQLDLSGAHFEQIGTAADIDNPFVPDMIKVRAGDGALGRGYPNGAIRSYGLARRDAAERLTSAEFTQFGRDGRADLTGIPAEAVLDIVSLTYTPAIRARLDALGAVERECSPWLSPPLEQAVAPIIDGAVPQAMRRRSLGLLPSGRELLQRTRTSARDFEYAPPLRRSLNK